jgi:hypothetical protein
MPAVHERARHDLFEAVQTTLGPDHADTLMSLLPPVGWADVATTHDLDQLESRLDMRLVATRQDIDAKFEAVDHRFAAVDHRFDVLAADIDARFAAVDRRFEELESRLDLRFEAVDHRFDALEHKILGQLHRSQRELMLAMVGALATMASLFLGAAALAG